MGLNNKRQSTTTRKTGRFSHRRLLVADPHTGSTSRPRAPSIGSGLGAPLVHPCRGGTRTELEPPGLHPQTGGSLPPSTLCGCDQSPGSGGTPTGSLAALVSPHSACALAGEKMGRVREKTHFSDSEEETACLGPRCCSFQDAVSGERTLLCVAVCLRFPDPRRSGDSHGEAR